MPYEFYKILHLLGIFMLFISIGGVIIRGKLNDTSAATRKYIGIMNGVGLLVILVAGFGIMARLGISLTDGWVLSKLAIWLIFGGLLAVANRKPQLIGVLTITTLVLGVMAAYLAILKPF